MQSSKSILSTSILALLCAGATASALPLDIVTIGDPGNPNDPLTGGLYGGVSSTYAIGKYEVTLNQYTAFLNAVAATDTYNLYNPAMASDLNSAGILRENSPGSYAYSVIGTGTRPVTYVSFYDAMRYANWLGTGSTETGAYTLLGGTPTPSNGLTVTRNGGAQVWIPSENEWYKAAYYDPSAGGPADDYWLYPMRSDAAPTNNSPGAGTNRGNFYDGDFAVTQSGSASSSQNYLTTVGAYTDSASYYGTFDQGGNVFEWNDAIISSSRGLRGGSWLSFDFEDNLFSEYRGDLVPTTERDDVGFRIATVPEPTSAVLLLGGGALLALRRRRSPAGA